MVFGGLVRTSGTPEGLRAQESGGWISAIVSIKRKEGIDLNGMVFMEFNFIPGD